jgi:hypothetical protein
MDVALNESLTLVHLRSSARASVREIGCNTVVAALAIEMTN